MSVDQKAEKFPSFNLSDPQVLPVTYDATLQRPVLFTPLLDWFARLHDTVALDYSGLDFKEFDKDLVTKEDKDAVRGAMLIESHNPVYTMKILEYYRNDVEMTTFEVIWGEEEVKHFALLYSYLDACGVDLRELRDQTVETRKGPWGDVETAFTRMQSFTYAMMQEQFTARFYKRFADYTKEPLLQKILRLISKDEYRHCQFYTEKAKQELAQDPGKRIKEVDQLILDFNMPGPTFVKDYDETVYKPGMIVAPVDRAALKESADKIAQVVGKGHLRWLGITNPSYARRLHDDFGVSVGDLLAATV